VLRDSPGVRVRTAGGELLDADELQRLKALLRNLHRHHTYVDLAEKMGVSDSTLADIMAGRRRGSHALLIRAAQVAGVPVGQVLDGGLVSAGFAQRLRLAQRF
jgi:transcriptional regulator with XRE-family HTH domain